MLQDLIFAFRGLFRNKVFATSAILTIGLGIGSSAVSKFWNAVHKSGEPLVEEVPGEKDFSFLTFLWQGNDRTRNVVIFDGVAGFDAKDRMLHLDATSDRYARGVWCLKP